MIGVHYMLPTALSIEECSGVVKVGNQAPILNVIDSQPGQFDPLFELRGRKNIGASRSR